MKYIIIDQTQIDFFTTEADTLDEAIKEAEIQFNRLTKADKGKRAGFYILKSINPDEDAENHFDGDIIKRFI